MMTTMNDARNLDPGIMKVGSAFEMERELQANAEVVSSLKKQITSLRLELAAAKARIEFLEFQTGLNT